MPMVKRFIIILTLIALVFAMNISNTFAEQSQNPEVRLAAIGTVNPGGRITISGETTMDEITIRVITPKNIIMFVDTTKDKNFSVNFTLPDDAETGEYQVVAGTGDIVDLRKFTVTEKEVPAYIELNEIESKNPGDRVTISGTTTLDEITIRVISPKNTVIFVDITKNANFSISFILPDDADLGEYQVVAGAGEIVALKKFTVSRLAYIVSIDEVRVETEAGKAPVLPSVVTARYSDGSTRQVPVVWDAIDPSKYATAGVFTVEGTVEGTSIKAVARITVVKKPDSGGSGDYDDSGSSDSGSGRVTPTPAPGKPDAPEIEGGNIVFSGLKADASGSVNVAINETDIEKALEGVTADAEGIKTIIVSIPSVEGATDYRLAIPKPYLTSEMQNTRIVFATDNGTVELPSNMLNNTEIEGEEIIVSLKMSDTEGLSEELAEEIGNRPIIELSVYAGDNRISWNNIYAPVKVTLRYEPVNPYEALNHEFITVWYIDGEGNVVPVTNARYNNETKEISFRTTHFSRFAVVYVRKSFNDLGLHPWARHEIEVLASKGVIKGISAELYDPSSNITRADFLKLLITALDLRAEITDNFTDVVESDYFYETVGIAKALGIVKGVGGGKFEPRTPVTRQDMMVMVERALNVAKIQLDAVSERSISSFDDADKVADYAKTAVEKLIRSDIIRGSNNMINPGGYTTRAEAAVVLYRIYNRQ